MGDEVILNEATLMPGLAHRYPNTRIVFSVAEAYRRQTSASPLFVSGSLRSSRKFRPRDRQTPEALGVLVKIER